MRLLSVLFLTIFVSSSPLNAIWPFSSSKDKEPKPITYQQQKVILHGEAARFSYEQPTGIKNGTTYYSGPHSGKEYKVVNEFESDSGKYRAIALMDNQKNLYLSYRGTVGKGDLRTDAIIGANNVLSKISDVVGTDLTLGNSLEKNRKRSIEFYDNTLNKLKGDNVQHNPPVIVGHSLGGMMAQLVGHETGAETHTFNAPGANIYGYYDDKKHKDNITNHVRSTDIVGNWGKHIGNVAEYKQSSGKSGLLSYVGDQHKMSYFTEDLKKGMTPTIYEHGKK